MEALRNILRFLLRRFVLEPERILGFPPLGGFWSSISPPLNSLHHIQEEIDLAQLCLEIGGDSLVRDLSFLTKRAKKSSDLEILSRWRGEHYKFLTELSMRMKPNLIVEIGTYRGFGSLALAQGAKSVVTFDIVPWNEFPNTAFKEEDFNNQLKQIVEDLSDEGNWQKELALIGDADIVFLDGPKDSIFEHQIIPKLLKNLKKNSLLIIDDIRFLNMRQIWETISMPKFDATSVAHFSGTGVVRICKESCCFN